MNLTTLTLAEAAGFLRQWFIKNFQTMLFSLADSSYSAFQDWQTCCAVVRFYGKLNIGISEKICAGEVPSHSSQRQQGTSNPQGQILLLTMTCSETLGQIIETSL